MQEVKSLHTDINLFFFLAGIELGQALSGGVDSLAGKICGMSVYLEYVRFFFSFFS